MNMMRMNLLTTADVSLKLVLLTQCPALTWAQGEAPVVARGASIR